MEAEQNVISMVTNILQLVIPHSQPSFILCITLGNITKRPTEKSAAERESRNLKKISLNFQNDNTSCIKPVPMIVSGLFSCEDGDYGDGITNNSEGDEDPHEN